MPSLFIFAISLTAGISTKGYLSRAFDNTVYNAANLTNITFRSRLSIMQNEIELVANNESLQAFARNGSSEGLAMNQLQSLAGASYVLGATVYSMNDKYSLASPGVSNYPTHSTLSESSFLTDFLENSQTSSTLWLRFNNIAGAYEFISYNENYGILSFVSKLLFEDGSLLGYLLVDLNSEHLYINYFDFNDYNALGSVITYFSNDGKKFLHSINNENYADEFFFQPNEKIARYSYAHSRYTFHLDQDFYLTLMYENNTYNNQLWLWISFFFVFFIIHTIVVIILANKANKNIVNPLITLQKSLNDN